MKIALSDQVDLFALGEWLERNVGAILEYLPANLATPYKPVGTPISLGRRWVIEFDFSIDKLVLEVDGRKVKPQARTELILKFT